MIEIISMLAILNNYMHEFALSCTLKIIRNSNLRHVILNDNKGFDVSFFFFFKAI